MRRWLMLILAAALTACGDRPSAGIQPVPAAGLENVHRVADGLLAGSQPEGEAGFRSLRDLGVRTVISVDGAMPEVERARTYGLRYVHLPIGYDGVPPARAREIARAVRDLPGPVYLHCHHGKHRSAAAAAVAGVLLGMVPPELAEPLLAAFQTGPQYTGLWRDARAARPVSKAEIDAAAADFPAVTPPPGLVAAMAACDDRISGLDRIRAAHWRTPPAHPDLDPPHEALQLREHLAEAARDPAAIARGPEFRARLDAAVAAALRLEEALRARQPSAELDAALGALRTSCVDCHREHRDHRDRR